MKTADGWCFRRIIDFDKHSDEEKKINSWVSDGAALDAAFYYFKPLKPS